ncbi:MAG: hypothetical protein ACLFPX_04240 [Candidatus Omnitrophota bacterium]
MNTRGMIVIILVLTLLGCSSMGRALKDPNFVGYEDRMERLESRYLNDEISYAEYRQMRDTIEGEYQKEADRNRVIVEGE